MSKQQQMVNGDTVLSAKKLGKKFGEPGDSNSIEVLREIDVEILAGQTLAIVGASGSGKSTLLHLLGGLDSPSCGSLNLMGKEFDSISESERSDWRNRHLGFVYQFHHLLAEFSAQENVAMPLLIRRIPRQKAMSQAAQTLSDVGLSHRLSHRPGELSGGERQRVAIARALITRPACIFADEPTGNLDSKTAHIIFDLLLSQSEEYNASLVIVTHDHDLAKKAQRVFMLDNFTLNPLLS